jgi:hypothetical protein
MSKEVLNNDYYRVLERLMNLQSQVTALHERLNEQGGRVNYNLSHSNNLFEELVRYTNSIVSQVQLSPDDEKYNITVEEKVSQSDLMMNLKILFEEVYRHERLIPELNYFFSVVIIIASVPVDEDITDILIRCRNLQEYISTNIRNSPNIFRPNIQVRIARILLLLNKYNDVLREVVRMNPDIRRILEQNIPWYVHLRTSFAQSMGLYVYPNVRWLLSELFYRTILNLHHILFILLIYISPPRFFELFDLTDRETEHYTIFVYFIKLLHVLSLMPETAVVVSTDALLRGIQTFVPLPGTSWVIGPTQRLMTVLYLTGAFRCLDINVYRMLMRHIDTDVFIRRFVMSSFSLLETCRISDMLNVALFWDEIQGALFEYTRNILTHDLESRLRADMERINAYIQSWSFTQLMQYFTDIIDVMHPSPSQTSTELVIPSTDIVLQLPLEEFESPLYPGRSRLTPGEVFLHRGYTEVVENVYRFLSEEEKYLETSAPPLTRSNPFSAIWRSMLGMPISSNYTIEDTPIVNLTRYTYSNYPTDSIGLRIPLEISRMLDTNSDSLRISNDNSFITLNLSFVLFIYFLCSFLDRLKNPP